ncbi:MAG TPA: AI-2E family transporter [Candidatus Scybalocola faecavium]|nr:AI-2E family transporter [Candidatus Scybalocola faecavium]
MDLNKNNMKKILFIIFLGILFYTAIGHLNIIYGAIRQIISLLFPILLGMSIAFVLNVPMRAIERGLFGSYNGRHKKLIRKIRRPVSFIVTLLCIIGVICIVILFIAPQLVNTIQSIISAIPVFFNRIQNNINDLLNEYQWIADKIGDIEIDWGSISSHLTEFLRSGAEKIFSSAVGIATSVINGIVTFFLGFFFAIYILFQKEKLSSQCRKLLYAYIPEKRADRIIEIASLSSRTFSKFLSGQCLEAVILGTMFFIVMSIIGLPYALLIGVLIAFTALIPIVGAFLGCIIGALLMLMVSPGDMLLFVVLFLILQQIEGNFIYPKVVGSSVGLPALWVLAAVTIGGNLWGVAGMLICIPLFSVFYTLLRNRTHIWLKKKNIRPQKYL